MVCLATVRAQGTYHPPEDAGRARAAWSQQAVRTGIDVLAASDFAALAGRKVGLITNHTGIDRTGVRTVDLLWNSEAVDLVTLFSPEHGFAGSLDQSHIKDAEDEGTGLVIRSLYGETRKPSAEMLEGVDTLVFDIQDIGCRFYTYISTMGLAMEAAQEHGLRFVVLDRPNPIDGVTVQGPMRDPGVDSFVAWHDLPVRHGMTVGELATMFVAERFPKLDLHVVKMEGWDPAKYWDATGLVWIDPSPNMRSLKQALVYPGIGLIEGTNVSVGRGTDTPFERIGAPWMDGLALAAALNDAKLDGVRFVPIQFTPDATKHKNELCSGVYVMLTDWAAFDPLETGIELALAIRRLHPKSWDPKRWNWLLCNAATAQAVLDGQPRAEITATWQEGLRAFAPRRASALLYPRQPGRPGRRDRR